jgi:hypothetical protein
MGLARLIVSSECSCFVAALSDGRSCQKFWRISVIASPHPCLLQRMRAILVYINPECFTV